MSDQFRTISIMLAFLLSSSFAVLPVSAEDSDIPILPVDGTEYSFSVTNPDTSDTSCISVYQFTLDETCRVEFTVASSENISTLNFGIQNDPVDQEFRWTDSDSLDFHSNQIGGGKTVTLDYVMNAGTYYFWTEIINYDSWAEPCTGTISALSTPLKVTVEKSDNLTREAAAEIQTGAHYYDVITADLSHYDSIASALYDKWYKVTIDEAGLYFMLGNLNSNSCEHPDSSHNVFYYKEDEESYMHNSGWHTREYEESNGRRVYSNMWLEEGTYYFNVTNGTLNDGGIGFEFGLYPFTRGDAAADGKVNLDDASAALSYYACKAAGLEASFTDGEDDFAELMAWLQANADRYIASSTTTSTINESENPVNLDDASAILSFYAQTAAGMSPEWKQ